MIVTLESDHKVLGQGPEEVAFRQLMERAEEEGIIWVRLPLDPLSASADWIGNQDMLSLKGLAGVAQMVNEGHRAVEH